MRQGLALSGLTVFLGFAWIAGCATGSTTTQSSGGVGGGGSGTTSTTSATTSTTSATTSTTSSTASVGGGGSGGGTTSSTSGTGGTTNPGLPVGADCTQDSDCESMLCKPVVIGVNPVCVTPCTQQSDCGVSNLFFCESITPGSPDGYCIPHSPAHCLSCMADKDCGSLSEVCFQAPGDIAQACHVDCSLAGDSACPQDYSCTDQMVNGQPRKLCRPKLIPNCLDAIGGFCDRLGLPQPCLRTNTAGSCLGQRSCLPGVKRFDKCDAMAPQCKSDCSAQDPAGCMTSFCPGATNSPTNCGMCGMVCPGYMTQFSDVACQNGMTCTFTCQGEHYDVDGNAGNGCEVMDPTTGNHTSTNTPTSLGSISCSDDPIIGTPKVTVQVTSDAFMISDARQHNPAIAGFDPVSGSAPDWYKINATGGVCVNDVAMTLQMQGSAFPTCYKMSVITDKGTYTCTTGTNGACTITKGSGSYSDNSTVFIKIEKTCGTNQNESVAYTVLGHL
jgi:hypothetical protein